MLDGKKIGLKIPTPIIRNSPKNIKSRKNLKDQIVKPISIGSLTNNDRKYTVQTNMVNTDVPLKDLKYCPAYFQEYINKDYDIRLTVVGRKIFPVKIISDDNIDWRHPGISNSYESIEMPKDVV
ncbi:hypothetical protein [Desulfosediminicola sp.]|uniref:hypothetical protein n=1 Tax=Desulfosediminicola sp. TaxID=2886825 RepID=UPI003AF2646D